ncbi:hypothetical protein EDB84DRAFT_1489074 [Lactarius hengduanensis]|nr:hypothetical protein EDB84DRAFT_1489074 [Lactarius hengduanensis]
MSHQHTNAVLYGVCILCICWRPGDIRLANIRNPIINPFSPEATVWFAASVRTPKNPLVLGLGPRSRPQINCKCSQRLSRPIVQLMPPQGPTAGLRPRNRRELSGHVVMMLASPFASIFSKTLGRTFWLMPRDRTCTLNRLSDLKFVVNVEASGSTPFVSVLTKPHPLSLANQNSRVSASKHVYCTFTPDFPL